MTAGFERLCPAAGAVSLAEKMEHDAEELCCPRHEHIGNRWGRTAGKIGFRGGANVLPCRRGLGTWRDVQGSSF
jgi:hypothetical protein